MNWLNVCAFTWQLYGCVFKLWYEWEGSENPSRLKEQMEGLANHLLMAFEWKLQPLLIDFRFSYYFN